MWSHQTPADFAWWELGLEWEAEWEMELVEDMSSLYMSTCLATANNPKEEQ
jgi:hypothetical protein